MRLTDIADLLVVVTAIVPLFAPTLMLLRVSGALRIVRAFAFMSRAQPFSKWLHVKSFVVSKVVNLIVFTFIMTALVFVKRAHQNDLAHGQLDALYVTVTLLTTTGDDDRAPGVMLVLQLVRAIAVGNTLRWK